MRHAIEAVPQGWPSEGAVARITLAYQDRYRRRIRLTCDDGEAVLLDLPKATLLADGDGLRLDDGGWLAVSAAEEDVLEVEARDGAELARWAWHLGNRHLPVQVLPPLRLRLLADPVIGEMLIGLGASPAARRAPFAPERGAYDKGGTGHHHSHD